MLELIIYNAQGEKVKKIVQANLVTRTTDYIDGFQYKQGILQFYPTSEGYVDNTYITGANKYNYVYQYKDQLGNIRLSYSKDPESGTTKILEENHYYPYGLKHTNYNDDLYAIQGKDTNADTVPDVAAMKGVPIDGTLLADTPNKYKFNGMEYQDELGLNLYDMDMRDYDPAIARWTGIDPVTHFEQSSYMGMNGNPVTFADPSGADGVVRDPTGTVYGMAGQSATVNYGGPMGGHTRVWMGAHSEYEMSWEAHEEAKQLSDFSIGLNGGELEISKSGKISIWNWSQEASEFGVANQLMTGTVRILKDRAVDFSPIGIAVHYEVGERKNMLLRASSINLKGTNQRELGLTGKTFKEVNLFDSGKNFNSLTFGRLNMTRVNSTQFTIEANMFDFDYQADASFSRNAGTFLGGLLFGRVFNTPLPSGKDSMTLRPNYVHGGPFNIIFLGTVTIPK